MPDYFLTDTYWPDTNWYWPGDDGNDYWPQYGESAPSPTPVTGSRYRAQIYSPRQLSLHVYNPTIASYTPAGTFAGNFGEAVVGWQHGLGADGWFLDGRFEIAGNFTEVEDWLESGLGRHVEGYSPEGKLIYEGVVNTVVANIGGLAVTRGPLFNIGNRVSVSFTPILDETQSPPLTGTATTTIITEDADSQAVYGIIEKIVSAGTITDTIAEQIRDSWLAENALPETSSAFELGRTGPGTVVINCIGYTEFLKNYVYNQTASSASVTISTKLQSTLTADPNGVISTNYDLVSSNGLLTSSYENEDRDAFTIIREIVSQGDVNDNRFTFGLKPGRVAEYAAIPTTVRYRMNVYRDQQNLIEGGALTKPWLVEPGEFVAFDDFLVGRNVPTTLRQDPRIMFIERINFTAPHGLRLTGGKVSRLAQRLARLGLGGE